MVEKSTIEDKYNNACCMYNQYMTTRNVEYLRQGLCDIYDVADSVPTKKVQDLKRAMSQAYNNVTK